MAESGLRKQKNTKEHFDRVAKMYDDCRTFDVKPVHHLAGLVGRNEIRLCDLGCGTGRYLLPLMKILDELGTTVKRATGVDVNPSMLEVAKTRTEGFDFPVDWVFAPSYGTGLKSNSVTLVTAFNSFHHLPIEGTVEEIKRVLEPQGYLAIYSRTKDQEAEHIWGKHFPDYLDYSQVLDREVLGGLLKYGCYKLIEEKDFTFKRYVPFTRVYEQTKNKHYSTLALYDLDDFEKAFDVFVENVKRSYDDLETITYESSYTLFLYKMES
ncbi:MAG: class I SAM-dependent methyltransferase [Thermoleophilia bacterium]